MANLEFRNLDEYEIFFTEKMTPWSPAQRVALAVAIAERWLPAYESFSAAQSWGDPASLRRCLDAVWNHVQGRSLAERDIARYTQQVEEITPHMDDFDAEEALTTCVAVKEALATCGDATETISRALATARGIFEGLVLEWPTDPASEARVWKKISVRKELQAQLALIDEIDRLTALNGDTVKTLRARIAPLKVKAAPKAKPKKPAALTNQTLFEQYRRMVESDLKGQARGQVEPTQHPYLFALSYLAYWLARYSRRRQTIDGSYGPVADELGQRALVARNRALDSQEKDPPPWDNQVRDAIDMSLRTNKQLKVLDVDSVNAPPAYGPSLRRLWLEGRRAGQSDEDGWKSIRAWAEHRPAAWEVEDRRKKKGLAHTTRDLGEKFAREISWRPTGDPIYPWAAQVGGNSWRIRINDFPDEPMYSVIDGNQNAGDFHDWPESWQRSSDAAEPF